MKSKASPKRPAQRRAAAASSPEAAKSAPEEVAPPPAPAPAPAPTGTAAGATAGAGGAQVPGDAAARLRELCAVEGSEGGALFSRRRLISPFEIHFSQSHIRPDFQDGRNIEDSAAEVQRELLGPFEPLEADLGEPLLPGAPAGAGNWWLLRPPFPEIEVIQWRIKLRDEDGNTKIDETGMELYGDKEWYTLDNRRLYCLQKAATASYPSEVRCIVSVIQQEDGNCREFRKFRTADRGRTVGVGHRDSADLPRWSWRREVGLEEEVFSAGAAIAKQPRRRGPNSRGHSSSGKGRRNSEEDRPRWEFMANMSFFLIVYLALRAAFHLVRWLLLGEGAGSG